MRGGACRKPLIQRHALNGEFQVGRFSTSVVQPQSRVPVFATPWTAARQASLSFTISQRLLKLLSIESVILSNSLVLCCPLLLSPSIHFCVCAKLLQSCLTLCDPLYCHPPGSSVYGILSSKLTRPWDSTGKNTGVGCHFLLQCMRVKRESEVAQLCLTLSDPMDCSPSGSSIHRIFQQEY